MLEISKQGFVLAVDDIVHLESECKHWFCIALIMLLHVLVILTHLGESRCYMYTAIISEAMHKLYNYMYETFEMDIKNILLKATGKRYTDKYNICRMIGSHQIFGILTPLLVDRLTMSRFPFQKCLLRDVNTW